MKVHDLANSPKGFYFRYSLEGKLTQANSKRYVASYDFPTFRPARVYAEPSQNTYTKHVGLATEPTEFLSKNLRRGSR